LGNGNKKALPLLEEWQGCNFFLMDYYFIHS